MLLVALRPEQGDDLLATQSAFAGSREQCQNGERAPARRDGCSRLTGLDREATKSPQTPHFLATLPDNPAPTHIVLREQHAAQ
jgi:hypothetical protein